MELLYIWLMDYKNIQKQGFNFSSQYFFTLREPTVDKPNDYQLIVSKNPDYIESFFEQPKLREVTGIIGQNGSGKSNVLDFIKENLIEGNHSPHEIAIIGLRKDEGIYLILPDFLTIDIVSPGIKITTSYYPMHNFKDGDPEFSFSNMSFVFYSNIFDLKRESEELTGLSNLSTNFLLQKDVKEWDNLTRNHESLGTVLPVNAVDAHRNNEIRRNVQFLTSKKYRNLLSEIPLPRHLDIEILKQDLNILGKRDNPDLVNVMNQLLKLEQTDDKIASFKNSVYVATFVNLITTDRRFTSPDALVPPQYFREGQSIEEFVKDFFKGLPLILYQDKYPNTYFEQKSIAALKFFDFMEQVLDNPQFVVERNRRDTPYLSYTIDEEDFSDLTTFLELYIRVKGFTDFLDFNWNNLSSGEQSFLSFISRFYHLKTHDPQKGNLKGNIVIMIDEGDCYFHPEWQKRFFKLSKDYLCGLFGSDHHIQLIYTANTPFITSDLPKSNVIFIEKISKRTINVQQPYNNQRQTFGANIHTLFADSFYMTGAIMGDFAKHKIDEIIKRLTGQEKTPSDPDDLRIINQIGEPILKKKLNELWIEKYGVDEEIAALEKRIEELKRGKNDPNQ